MDEIDKAFDHLFTQAKKYEIYRLIAGLFCLSKITFQDDCNERCMISSEHPLELTAQLLLFDRAKLSSALTVRTMKVSRDDGERIRWVY